MSGNKDIRIQGKLKRQTAYEESRLEERAKDNLQMMNQLVKILPEELTTHPNYKNYFLKYGAYAFSMDRTKCKYLCNIFLTDLQQASKNIQMRHRNFITR